ncbi:MAG: type I methionyl aminopeptidase [Eubacteriales bacterium]|nr:type I methionyl aminopeptidase [Eubacteriales bacterium]
MITLKSEKEIGLMKRAGEIVALVFERLQDILAPGLTTADLDKAAEDVIRSKGAIPSFKGYPGFGGAPKFPASICASVNDEVIHGIPDKRVLNEGDIISVDVGAIFKGFHGDAARTFAVGEISENARKLIKVTEQSFFEGMKKAVAGNRIVDISEAVQKYVEKNGFSVVREFVGHGIGTEMHEAPQIPNYVTRERGPRLGNGMTLAIEPMVNAGGAGVRMQNNLWTVSTADGSLSAHYENTIAVTENEPIILTALDN